MKIMERSKTNPVFFVEKIIGDKLWKKQRQIINAIQHSNVSVASCHGAGKSFTASRVVLHAMAMFPGTQVITTAPTNRQVKKFYGKKLEQAMIIAICH
jgi:ERCC4-related helicase